MKVTFLLNSVVRNSIDWEDVFTDGERGAGRAQITFRVTGFPLGGGDEVKDELVMGLSLWISFLSQRTHCLDVPWYVTTIQAAASYDGHQ